MKFSHSFIVSLYYYVPLLTFCIIISFEFSPFDGLVARFFTFFFTVCVSVTSSPVMFIHLA
ncbi:hypothetical protein AG1IA_03055 [Rhizoctonia solani AG-1 IA]|uniref:Uncharacterized protein n=1 Tax=Thanatephorus cucumeris (strain AG1-IA) TaxID=983506 RepID=L8X2Q9_THACA|nr:hypothetical protein AG1IA_03055 [Rhizoctonia solani AG-1 IA]